MMWNDGILEDWNNGFNKDESFFSILLAKKRLIRLRRTVFKTQYSIIPKFHYSIGRR